MNNNKYCPYARNMRSRYGSDMYDPYEDMPFCPYNRGFRHNYPNHLNYTNYPDYSMPGQYSNMNMNSPSHDEEENYMKPITLKDYGPEPFVVDIHDATMQNDTFRAALWTGKHLQLTLMSINPGEDIGIEMHPDVDQFIRIESGMGTVKMGNSRDQFDFQKKVYDDDVIFIPAGKWHNLMNTGNVPLKLYSIYAPPNHPRGTVHKTKKEAMEAEEHHH